MEKKHIRNEPAGCPACCCFGNYIHGKCGGRLHERLVDDTVEDGFIHNYKCDTCNYESFVCGYEDMPIEFEENE